MADRVFIKDGNRVLVPVLSDEITIRNGQVVTDGDEAQIIKLAHGGDGEAQDVSTLTPMPIGDFSAPLRQLSIGGMDLVAGEMMAIVDANLARGKVDVMCDQDDGTTPVARVWVSCGDTDAEVGKGNFLRPGGQFQEWTDQRVTVVATEDCSVTWVEWGI